MRILLISRCPPYPLHLGDRLILWHLSRELAQRGHQIDLLAFAQLPSDWDEVYIYQAWFQHVKLIAEPRRTAVQYLTRSLWAPARFPHNGAQAWSAAMWDAVEECIGANEYDVVHLFGGIQVYEFAELLTEQACLITPYEAFSLYLRRKIGEQGQLMDRLRLIIAQNYERWMFRPYARVVVLSQTDAETLRKLNPSVPVSVVSNGIDLDYFQPMPTERDPATLLFVGNFEYAPNVDAALLLAEVIVPAVRQAIPEVRLQLVGNAPPAALRRLTSDGIEVTGRVPDVRPYLARASIFVCPLRFGAGIKNKVLEALAMGIPLIATPLSVDGIAVTHEQHALICEVEHMPQQIVRALHDDALKTRLTQAGPELITQRYSWSAVAEQYLTLYQGVIQTKLHKSTSMAQ